MRRALRLAGLVAILTIAVCAGAAATELALDPGAPDVRLLGRTEALVDPTGSLTLDAVTRPGRSWQTIERIPGASLAQPVAVWYRFTPRRRNGADEAWALYVSGLQAAVALYWHRPDGSIAETDGGDSDLRLVNGASNHVLVLPESAFGTVTYVRAMSAYAKSSPRLIPLDRAVSRDRSLFDTFGGFFIAIGLFNFALYAVLRQRSLLEYAAVMAAVLGLFATDDAIWHVVGPVSVFARALIHACFGWLYFAASAAFTLTFLQLRERDPLARSVIIWITLLSAIGIPGEVLDVPFWYEVLAECTVLATVGSLVWAGVRAAQRGFRPARFYVVGSAGLFLGVASNTLQFNVHLPLPEFSAYIFELAIGWEALLLAVALAEGMNEIAQENARLSITAIAMRNLAMTDGLTQVANRRAFDERLAEEWSRAGRSNVPLGLLLIDVDHFKKYNDLLGHQAGDEGLRAVAAAGQATLRRSGEVFARYGGEEFAAILPATTEDEVRMIGERMREAVAALGIAHPSGGTLSISVGGATWAPQPGESPDLLVAAADSALYRAKAEGRNRVVL